MDYQQNLSEWIELLSSSRLGRWLEDPASRRQLTRRFLYLFWWYYFPHYHQRRIPAYKIHQTFYSNHPRLLIVDARDHGKSVLWSCGYPLWVTLTNPYDQPAENVLGGGFRYERGTEEIIAQISLAGDLPIRFMRRHKSELQYNPRLVRDWGNQSTANMREGIWQNDHILLKNGAQIYSKGSYSQIRGDHPTEAVVDDLEDRQLAQNPENRKKMKAYFFADLYGALEPYSRLKVIGTFVHPECLLKELFEKEIKTPAGLEQSNLFKHRWAKFKYQALLPDGEPLAPEIWPKEQLLIRKAELMAHAPAVWRAEYMNEPETAENPIFPETWFRAEINGYNSKDPKFGTQIRNLKIFSFADPAAKEKEMDDYTAVVTVGVKTAKRPEVYVLEVKNFRKSFRGNLSEVLNTWLKWRGRIGFEAIAFSSWLGSTFHEICDENHYNPDYYLTDYREKEKHKKEKPKPYDKVSRAQRVTYFWEYGLIYFDYDEPMTQLLIDQLKYFPNTEHDDMVDALVGVLWEIDRWVKNESRKKAPGVDIRYDETGRPIYVDTDAVDDYLKSVLE